MKKWIKAIFAGVVSLSMLVGTAGNVEASTSQASYKLTAYNNKGKKVNVSAPKNMVVKYYKNGWYSGTLKYTNYVKKSGKWIKSTKTSTIYMPAKYVKKYETKNTKWVKYVKDIQTEFDYLGVDEAKAWFKGEFQEGYVGVGKGEPILLSPTENDYLYVENSKGIKEIAKTLNDDIWVDGVEGYVQTANTDIDNDGINNYEDDDIDGDEIENYYDNDSDGDGIMNNLDNDSDNDGVDDENDYSDGYYSWGFAYNVSYIDYDKETYVSKTDFKTSSVTQAYTKVYVAPVKNGITLAEYNKIKTGMTYQQVVNTIGENGNLESSASGYGTTIKIYSWSQKSTYGSASILFENNKVQSKSQAGLK